MNNQNIIESNKLILEIVQRHIEYEQTNRRIPVLLACLLLSLAMGLIYSSVFFINNLAIQQVLIGFAGLFVIFALNTFKSIREVEMDFSLPSINLDSRTFINGDYNSREITSHNTSNQNLIVLETAAEIQKILNHISTMHPDNTTQEKIIIATETINEIEESPILKQRIISAVKAGGIEAFRTMLAHPASAITLAALETWLSEENTKIKK